MYIVTRVRVHIEAIELIERYQLYIIIIIRMNVVDNLNSV
jgi:hypothetical protein